MTAILRRRGFAAFCLLSLALSYGMIANIIAILGSNMAERWIYLPSAFFLMWLATLIARLPRPARLTLMIALLTLGSIRTFTYARRWNDRLTFYERCLDEQPRSAQLYLLTAGELDAHHDYPAADAVMARAATVFPDAWHVWMRRAIIAMDAGNLDDAEVYLRRSFELNPNPIVIGVSDRLDQLKAARKAATTSATTTKGS
jgi:tetratricopeptide (TPR) repeat protein